MPASEVSMQEARLAKVEMNGRLAYGRPLVVRFACEKYLMDAKDAAKSTFDLKKPCFSSGSGAGQMSRSAKILAIKNKLKALEQEGCSFKRSKRVENVCASSHLEDGEEDR